MLEKMAEALWLPWYKKLPDDENQADSEKSGEYEQPPSCWRLLRYRPSFLFISLSCFGLLFAITAIFMLFQRSRTSALFYPTLQTTLITFEEHPLFMSAPSPESDAAWNSLIPSGRGFVLVEDPEKYHLKPGLPTEVGPDRYSVSMFHQLHCLGILRESYYSALHSTKPKIFGEDKLSGELLKHAHSEHVGHCFDYLRQAIMCAADLSLEWAGQTASGTPLATVDGWGIPHQCRSWDQAFEWTLKHRAPHNYTGIA